jgi:NAD(P)-dependent dehydrogenase (short-subunit alcohol dehydrogenase family)
MMTTSFPSMPERAFDWDAQNQFAKLSGDRNPMHIDAVAARRTHAGQPVVHGIHAILWALETLTLQKNIQQPIAYIKVGFQKLIYIGDLVAIKIIRQDTREISVHLCVDGLAVSTILAQLGPPSPNLESENSPQTLPPSHWPEKPIEHSLDDIKRASGLLSFAQNSKAAVQLFPQLSALIGAQRVAALACMSRLVGMVCPGMHSTFFSFALHTIESHPLQNGIKFHVASVHDTFRLVKQTVEGAGWSGVIQSVARIPPVTQASLEELARVVRAGEFSGPNALVLGGGRGLGELTTKLIVAGGGAVTITYAVGRDDAIKLQQEIHQWGGKCEIIQYDATLPAANQLQTLTRVPNSLYYFATPHISLRKTRLYTPAIFEKLQCIYADGFYDLCTSLLRDAGPVASIFYPSSVFVEERPSDMTEYAMAKAAGEILCSDLARSNQNVRFVVERLPRMLTDQTATAMPIKMIEPLEVMLPIVRRMEARDPS